MLFCIPNSVKRYQLTGNPLRESIWLYNLLFIGQKGPVEWPRDSYPIKFLLNCYLFFRLWNFHQLEFLWNLYFVFLTLQLGAKRDIRTGHWDQFWKDGPIFFNWILISFSWLCGCVQSETLEKHNASLRLLFHTSLLHSCQRYFELTCHASSLFLKIQIQIHIQI